jgi:DnaJ-class molecular chaperone
VDSVRKNHRKPKGSRNKKIRAKWPSMALEELCEDCGGRGRVNDGSGWARCSLCSGAGFVPTVLGISVLELIRHNFKSMYNDVQDK